MRCERSQNALKQPQMAHFAPQLFIQTYFYETLQKVGINCHEQKNSVSDSEKILVHHLKMVKVPFFFDSHTEGDHARSAC